MKIKKWEWLNPVLWAQNVFPECSDGANGAHETIHAVLVGNKIVKKKIEKKFLFWKIELFGKHDRFFGRERFHELFGKSYRKLLRFFTAKIEIFMRKSLRQSFRNCPNRCQQV